MAELSDNIRVVIDDADVQYGEVTMWKARAAMAEDAARAASAALAEATAEKVALERRLDEYRNVVEQSRRMSGCEYVKFTFVVHLETPTIGVTLEVSVFDLKQ